MNPVRLRLKRATAAFLEFIAGTRHSLELENWIYIPSDRVEEIFASLLKRKVQLQVITNADMDGPEIFSAAEEYLMKRAARKLGQDDNVIYVSKNGALRDAFALTPAKALFRLHAKVALRDRRDLIVGSYNIDPRSYDTNIESMVMVKDCPELAAHALEGMNEIRRAYLSDVRNHRVRATSPSLLSKIVAFLSYNFL